MSYLVIARRFRPQTFASIVGQEHISRALSNAIIRDRLAHALLFTGPRGVGKTTTARVLARALNCTGRDLSKLKGLGEAEAREFVEPCGECPNCLEIAKGTSLACREIDGASNNSVDNIRELIDSLRTLPPPGSTYKIYLIDEVHMLSTAAFNALLKSLEEPPPNTIFIFATTDPQKIPETVISRCQQFDFRRLPKEVVIETLRKISKSEDVLIEEAVFRLIARKAQGGMRDAQSLLDRLLAFSEKEISLAFAESVFGVADGKALVSLARAVVTGEVGQSLKIIEGIFERSLDLKGFVSDLISIFRGIFLISLGGGKTEITQTLELDDEVIAELAEISRSLESFNLQRLYQLSQEMADRSLQSSFPRFAVEAGIARMAALPNLRPIAEILSGLSEGGGVSQGITGTTQKKSSVTALKAPSEENTEIFNPKWVDFVAHVKASSSPLLAQFLRRVSAKKFNERVLEIEGNAFDISHIKELKNLETLKKLLASYVKEENWEVTLHEAESSAIGQPAAHSLAAQEEDTRRVKTEEINRDVREDPLMQVVLATYPGAKIEKINPLKG